MSMTLFVVVDGHHGREAIKVSPMTRLEIAVEDLLDRIGKNKSKLQQGSGRNYALTLKRKPIDPSLPVRFSGLQNRDTLELQFSSSISSPSTSASPAALRNSSSAVARTQMKPTTTATTTTTTTLSSSSSSKAQGSGSGGGLAASSELELDRQLIVFHESVFSSASNAAAGVENLPDEFYNFTAEDFAKLEQMKQLSAKQKEAKTLQTRAMRERERQRKASQMPPVRMRIMLPDGWCLQCVFKATENVEDIYTFVRSLVTVDLASFELFTTPPRVVLSKTKRETIYDANLVPSAKIYLASKRGGGEGGSILKPAILDKYSVHSIEEVATHGKEKQAGSGPQHHVHASGSAQQASTAAATSSQPQQQQQKKKQSKGGMPKWLKLGK